MAKRSAKSGLMKKLGDAGKNAIDKAMATPVNYGGGGNLPGGMEGVICKLTSCYFKQYAEGKQNAGEYFFRASGVIVSPKEFTNDKGETTSIEGRTTSIGPEPLCDTPDARGNRKTVEDHVLWVVNEMQKLGAEVSETDSDDFEAIAESLSDDDELYFKLNTWQPEDSDRVVEMWKGAVDGFDPEGEGQVADEVVEDKDEEPGDDNSLEDLSELVRQAEEGDQGAEDRLKELAQIAGVSDEDYEAADWDAVVELIEGGETEEEKEEDDDDNDDWEPAKGDVYGFKPPRARRAIDVEVTAVFPGKETCNVKVIDGDKTYKGVAWDKLIQQED